MKGKGSNKSQIFGYTHKNEYMRTSSSVKTADRRYNYLGTWRYLSS